MVLASLSFSSKAPFSKVEVSHSNETVSSSLSHSELKGGCRQEVAGMTSQLSASSAANSLAWNLVFICEQQLLWSFPYFCNPELCFLSTASSYLEVFTEMQEGACNHKPNSPASAQS